MKEIALAATRRQCLLLDVQMLDDYVALIGCSLARDCKGKVRIKRRYLFEFSANGEDRYDGVCVMIGEQIAAIELAAHRFTVH